MRADTPMGACRTTTGDTSMFQKCTVSAVLAAILTITASAALAAPRQRPDETINRPTVPMTGAEHFQSRGVVEEDIGSVYRPRR
jgi:hypothetical protein